MSDYFEVDFLDVESDKSGDAITIRYEVGGQELIHVVDGGFQATGESLIAHIKSHYGNPKHIHHVVATHPDGDHAGGLRSVLEGFNIGALWMLRPWTYANELIGRFPRFSNVENLVRRLKEIYPNIAALEEIANRKGIAIYEPFQGTSIGAFTVLAPKRERYLDLVVASDRTPESEASLQKTQTGALATVAQRIFAEAVALLKAAWGAEIFSTEETSAENEMSVVQFGYLSGKKILLTGDTGRAGLAEAAAYAPFIGLALPGIDRFQVPHHGSRRNVSTETLDKWLGPRLPQKANQGTELFDAMCSSAKKDKDHPRKAVIRAIVHRGGRFFATEGQSVRWVGGNAPARQGWGPVTPMDYPDEMEE